MEKELKFRFYSVLKNEDAPPFLSDELLVVADGLGGDGSTEHAIDRAKHKNLKKEIVENAFGDFEGGLSSEFVEYLDELLYAMSDETNDTSALWGSRIVIGRFVYALMKYDRFSYENLRDESARDELTEFIKRGFFNIISMQQQKSYRNRRNNNRHQQHINIFFLPQKKNHCYYKRHEKRRYSIDYQR